MQAVGDASAESPQGRRRLRGLRGAFRKLERFWVPAALLLGVLVGLVLPVQAGGKNEWPSYRRFSSVLGWTYFCAWSASFYPQIALNFTRQSVVGLSLDYNILNILGFGCYFLFNIMLFTNEHVQDEYHRRYGGSSAVQVNDVFFAGHAFLATLVTLLQIMVYYDYPPLVGLDRWLRVLVVGSTLLVLVGSGSLALVIWIGHERLLTWLEFLSLLSVVKLVVSAVKYCPQVWTNFRLKSTRGWTIHNVLLDLTGGLLSVLQLLLDSWVQDDWSKITGDPVKFLLGILSMAFDVVFMLQHYCFYRGHKGHGAPLLHADPPSSEPQCGAS